MQDRNSGARRHLIRHIVWHYNNINNANYQITGTFETSQTLNYFTVVYT